MQPTLAPATVLLWRGHGASAEGISSVYLAGRPSLEGAEGRDSASRGGVQRAGIQESQKARTQTEGVVSADCVRGGKHRTPVPPPPAQSLIPECRQYPRSLRFVLRV